MKEIPDKHFDLAIVDPPYDSKLKAVSGKTIKTNIYRDAPTDLIFQELFELVKSNYMNYFVSHPQEVIIDKKNGESVIAVCELADSLKRSTVRIRKIIRRFHPTQNQSLYTLYY